VQHPVILLPGFVNFRDVVVKVYEVESRADAGAATVSVADMNAVNLPKPFRYCQMEASCGCFAECVVGEVRSLETTDE